MAKKPKRGYSPPKFREDEVNRLVELYKKNHPEEFQNVSNAAKRGHSSPVANREEVEKLKALYRKKHPEEFIRPGYPQKPTENVPPS